MIMFGQSVYVIITTRIILYMYLPLLYSIFRPVEAYIPSSFTYFSDSIVGKYQMHTSY